MGLFAGEVYIAMGVIRVVSRCGMKFENLVISVGWPSAWPKHFKGHIGLTCSICVRVLTDRVREPEILK